MGSMASQITSLTIVYSAVYSGAVQRKHQSSAALAFVRGIHRGPVNSPQKWPVTRKMFPFDDVIMIRSFICDKRRTKISPFCGLYFMLRKLNLCIISGKWQSISIRMTSWHRNAICISDPSWDCTCGLWLSPKLASDVEIWYFLCC